MTELGPVPATSPDMSSSGRCPEVLRRRNGIFVVDLDGAKIGVVTLDRRRAERERFEEYDAEQWFGVWSSVTTSG